MLCCGMLTFAGVAPLDDPPLASMHTEAARGNLAAVTQLVEQESPKSRKVRESWLRPPPPPSAPSRSCDLAIAG